MPIYNIEALLVLQIFGIGVAAILIGLPIYRQLRITSPELAWNFHGNVPVSHLDKIDLLGIGIASIIFSLNVILAPFINLEDIAAEQGAAGASTSGAIATLVSGVFMQAFPVFVTIFFLHKRCDIAEILGLRLPDWKRIALFSLLGIFAIFIFAGVSSFLAEPWLKKTLGEQNPQDAVKMMLEAKNSSRFSLLVIVFLACVVAPICEEIFFRGYLYSVLKRFSCRYFAVIISGLLFGAIHGSMWALIPLTIIGIILAIIYEKSGSLWTPIICHAVFNTINTTVLILHPDALNL